MQMRTVHRIISILIVAITLYLSVTGTLIELVDFRTLITKPSPFDPNLRAMREDFHGPGNYEVLTASDYIAPALPNAADPDAMLAMVMKSARARLGATPLKFVELRMIDGKPVGQVSYGKKQELRFDALSGASLGAPPPLAGDDRGGPPASLRNTIKHLHRMTTFGDWALWINIIASIGLATLIVTGVVIYYRVWRQRYRMKRANPYWAAGGWWRALHRSISISAALFLSVTTLSGAWLAYESLIFGMYLSHAPKDFFQKDAASPLIDSTLPAMLDSTLSAYQAMRPGIPARAIRLRYYGGMSQGVVITGEETADQLVFNTKTGRTVRLTEPGYPDTGFPFGWQAHQWAKSIHRGDFFGLTGRITSLLAGLSMAYLSVSGIVMYWRMWRKRRATGRRGFVWK
jgi:uncharacterized iron-regulated membrane protein